MRTGRPRTVSDEAIFDGRQGGRDRGRPVGVDARRGGRSGRALGPRVDPAVRVEAEPAARLQRSSRHRDRRRIHPSPQHSPTALSALRAALLELTAGIDSRHAIANHLAFLHLDLTDPELGAHAAKQSRLFRRAITQLLDEAITTGEIDSTDATELADTIYTVYNGALVTWAIDGTGSLTRWLSKRLDRVLAHHQPA